MRKCIERIIFNNMYYFIIPIWIYHQYSDMLENNMKYLSYNLLLSESVIV